MVAVEALDGQQSQAIDIQPPRPGNIETGIAMNLQAKRLKVEEAIVLRLLDLNDHIDEPLALWSHAKWHELTRPRLSIRD